MLELYTDGSCEPNPGYGGYAVIDAQTKQPVRVGEEYPSTNIRMEGMAIIEAIKYAGDEPCTIYTDSQFWVNVLTLWAINWEKKNFKGVKNPDLVKEAYSLYKAHPVRFQWVRGHKGNELNELADECANGARGNYSICPSEATRLKYAGMKKRKAVPKRDHKKKAKRSRTPVWQNPANFTPPKLGVKTGTEGRRRIIKKVY